MSSAVSSDRESGYRSWSALLPGGHDHGGGVRGTAFQPSHLRQGRWERKCLKTVASRVPSSRFQSADGHNPCGASSTSIVKRLQESHGITTVASLKTIPGRTRKTSICLPLGSQDVLLVSYRVIKGWTFIGINPPPLRHGFLNVVRFLSCRSGLTFSSTIVRQSG